MANIVTITGTTQTSIQTFNDMFERDSVNQIDPDSIQILSDKGSTIDSSYGLVTEINTIDGSPIDSDGCDTVLTIKVNKLSDVNPSCQFDDINNL